MKIPGHISRSLLLAVSLIAIPAAVRAQSARQLLTKAESLYNASSIEAARLEFLKVTNSRGQVSVADGTDLAAQKLERVLTNDPGMGVIRHVDAGYDRAVDVAAERAVRVPMREQA